MTPITNRFALKWLILLLFLTSSAVADKIVLKDGTMEESDRIWESENYIHFILKGTRTVEIRYAKSIVERIERRKPEDNLSIKPPGVQSQVDQSTKKEHSTTAVNQPSSGREPQARPVKLKPLDRQIARDNKAVSFYDPRRSKRYWASRKMKFTTLGAALEAMAELYDRSSLWVETHMGEENDLGIIHANLIQQRQREEAESDGQNEPPSSVTEQADIDPTNKIELPTQTSPGSKSKTKVEMSQVSSGVRFYDPRRIKKYWSSETAHHSTLKEAIDALANQYGVSAEWIERHLGDSNDLAEIHHIIQESMVTE